MIPKAKKSKKQKRPIEQVLRFEIIKLQNLLHISIMVRVLWTVYGWREKRIGYFLEAEIENIEKLLKDETVDDASKDILNKLLKEYKHDLEVIEREAV